MISYLIDTNVVSEIAKPQPDLNVMFWLDRVHPLNVYASVITFGEIRLGIENLMPGKRRSMLESWLDRGVAQLFTSNLLPVTKPIANRWAVLTSHARRKGVSLSVTDGIIAATAIEHGLVLVTRNVKDFLALGVTILNPWHPSTLTTSQKPD